MRRKVPLTAEQRKEREKRWKENGRYELKLVKSLQESAKFIESMPKSKQEVLLPQKGTVIYDYLMSKKKTN